MARDGSWGRRQLGSCPLCILNPGPVNLSMPPLPPLERGYTWDSLPPWLRHGLPHTCRAVRTVPGTQQARRKGPRLHFEYRSETSGRAALASGSAPSSGGGCDMEQTEFLPREIHAWKGM